MALKIPQDGDIRVCFLPSIPDHAITIDAPDMTSATLVFNALVSTFAAEYEHSRYNGYVEVIIQRFADGGWDEVDPIQDSENEEQS